MMKKLMMALIILGLTATSWGHSPLKLDMGLSTSGLEPGWQSFFSTDSGATLFGSVKVTISGASGWRNRTSGDLNGIPNEALWRDFVYSSSNLIITIEGLKPLLKHELSIGAFDIDSKTATPHSADWKVDGATVLSTSFGIPGVPLATLVPSADRNYLKTGYAYSDADGKIVIQSYPAADNGGGASAFLNALVISPVVWAYEPTPEDGTQGASLTTTLSWKTGVDPNNPTLPNPEIGMHYLYLTNEPNFINTTPIAIPAGSPVQADGSHGPLSLSFDKTYIWRVDEGVYVNGVLSGPDDPATITGKVWTFSTLKSIPVINPETLPGNSKIPAGDTAQFAVEFNSLSPVTVTWYKDGQAIVPDSRVTIDTTQAKSTLSITDAGLADEGGYVCEIVNAGGSAQTDPIHLAIARLLAHYPFEQNGNDAVGVNHGTAINGMDYAAGIVATDGQSWAADPNGANYFEVPAATAYPRAGFGNGLEEFTYSFWIKRGTYGGYGRIFGNFNNESNTAVQLNVTGAGALGCLVRQDGGVNRDLNTPTGTVTEDQWHHVAFTFDSVRVSCYVDGIARYYMDAFPMSSFSDWQYPMALMARNVRGSVNEYYPGQADDLRIYNYAMDREGIAKLYYDVTGTAPCIYGNPEFDVSGPEGKSDCVVNIYDFAEFAKAWLESGLFVPEN
ncbi:MAG: immunoglobulin domain-containing protein [Sedimentisphaerales bacterium]|nr:immunoglobulin domain-containing protein [Sedimentisphaerales bacterium]